MKKLLTFAFLSLVGTGCNALSGDHAHHGWFVGAWKPSSVDQQGVTLINQTAGQMGASPMGTLSGPITDANSTHAPVIPVPTLPNPVPNMGKVSKRYAPIAANVCEPCEPCPTLTLDQWIALQKQAERKKMPSGEQE